jgi:hypothetical protein
MSAVQDGHFQRLKAANAETRYRKLALRMVKVSRQICTAKI